MLYDSRFHSMSTFVYAAGFALDDPVDETDMWVDERILDGEDAAGREETYSLANYQNLRISFQLAGWLRHPMSTSIQQPKHHEPYASKEGKLERLVCSTVVHRRSCPHV